MQLSEYLKQETKSIHAQVELAMGAKQIFSENYTKLQYSEHLLKLLKAHTVLNSIISKNIHSNLFASVIPKNRISDIANDLDAVSNTQNSIEIKLHESENFESIAALTGLLYVIRGSELGGQFIAKALDSHIKLWQIPEQKYYIKTESDITYQKWSIFCNHINSLSSELKFHEEALLAAKMCFQIFQNPEDFANIVLTQK